MANSVQQRVVRRFIVPISALGVLLVVGTAGFRWLEGMTVIDALYMTVITLSTVGFGEVNQLEPAGRIFTICLIMGGAGLAAYILSSVADFMIVGEWRAYLEERRQRHMLEHLAAHIIVCGYGRVGRHVVAGLQAERLPFVVLDPDPEKIQHLQLAGVLAIEGNAAVEQDLKAAGIDRARGLVAAASSDAENVFIVLTARSLRPDLLILARANYEDSEPKLLRAGADRVVLPYSITGRRIVTMLARPDVADFLDEIAHTAGLELLLEQVQVSPTSPFVGQTVVQAQLEHRFGVTVLAYKPPGGQLVKRPDDETPLEAHAYLVVLGTGDQLQALKRLAGG